MALKNKTFSFEVASTEWVANHNFNKFVTSDVFVEYGGVVQKILPLNVEHVDLNTLKITFSFPQKGYVRLI